MRAVVRLRDKAGRYGSARLKRGQLQCADRFILVQKYWYEAKTGYRIITNDRKTKFLPHKKVNDTDKHPTAALERCRGQTDVPSIHSRPRDSHQCKQDS
jgi:hypothetical protein